MPLSEIKMPARMQRPPSQPPAPRGSWRMSTEARAPVAGSSVRIRPTRCALTCCCAEVCRMKQRADQTRPRTISVISSFAVKADGIGSLATNMPIVPSRAMTASSTMVRA